MTAHGTEDFENFARARAPALFRSAWALCGDEHQAQDLVQDTLAKVFVRWTRPLSGTIDNPAAYAHTVLVRTFISSRRRKSSTELPYAEVPDTTAPDTTADLALSVTVQDALAALTPLDRAVVVLRYLEDLSVDEVALRLNLSPGAVRNRSMRALSRIRTRSLL